MSKTASEKFKQRTRVDTGEGEPARLKRGEVGEFQRGVDAYLKAKGMTGLRYGKVRREEAGR